MSNNDIKKYIDLSKLYSEVDFEQNTKVEEGFVDWVKTKLGIDDKMLLNQTTDDWRIFSKLGFGYSSIRKQYEVTLNGYVCLPLHDGNGIEFVISAKTFDKTLDNGEQVDKKMRIGIQNVVKYLINTYCGGYS